MSMSGYTVCGEECQKIVEAKKQCTDKCTSKKLCIILKCFGETGIAEIETQMNCSETKSKSIVAEYNDNGLEEFMCNKYKGDYWSLSVEETKRFFYALKKCKMLAKDYRSR